MGWRSSLAIGLLALGGSGSAMAAPRADLVVSGGKAAVRDTTLRVSMTIVNRGRTATPATSANVVLTKGRRVVAGMAVPKLRAGRRSAVRATVPMPAGIAAGRYALRGCADVLRAVKERSERNNCRALRGRIRITPPRGITATATADASRVATATIGDAGGTISATGADGTTYTIEFPEHALNGEEAISMTPLASLAGSRMSGLVGGVQFAPDGLELQTPATLTITPAHPVAKTRVTPFAFAGGGADLHLYPGVVKPDGTIELPISHFSGAGAGDASPAEQAKLETEPAATPRSQGEQRVAAAIEQGRRSGKPVDDPEVQRGIIEAFAALYASEVGPQLAAALTDDSKAIPSIRAALTWARNVALTVQTKNTLWELDHKEPLYREHVDIVRKMPLIVKNAFQRAYRRCVGDHNPQEAVRLLSLQRDWLMLFGTGQANEIGLNRREEIQACARFELDLEGTYTFRGSTEQASSTTTVSAEVKGLKISLDPDFRWTFTPAHVHYTRATLESTDGCAWEMLGDAPSNPFELTDFRLRLNHPDDGRPDVAGMEINFTPGDDQLSVRETCPSSDPESPNEPYDRTGDYFEGFFLFARLDDPGNDFLNHPMRGFAPVGNGEIFARAHYADQNFPSSFSGDSQEDVTATLRHTPKDVSARR